MAGIFSLLNKKKNEPTILDIVDGLTQVVGQISKEQMEIALRLGKLELEVKQLRGKIKKGTRL